MHVLLIGLRGLLLDRVEAGGERLQPVAGDPGVIVELGREALALAANFLLDFGDLRLQFLDARVLVEQSGGLLGQLRAQRVALLDQPAHGFGIGDVRGFDRLARANELAQLSRPRLQIGLLPARRRDLRIDLGQLLIGQRAVVGADVQIGLGAIGLDLGFGVRHLGAQIGNFAGQPIAGGAGLVLLRGLLYLQVGFGDGIGDAGGEIGIGGEEVDHNHAGFFHRVDVEPVVIGFQHALFFRHGGRIADNAEQAEHNFEHRRAAQRRNEFRIIGKLLFLDHIARQIARKHKLGLAGHRFGIDGGAVAAVLVGFGAQEHVLARLQQQPRF